MQGLAKGVEEVFKAVGFDDVGGFELLAELPAGEALLLEPKS